MIKAMSEADLAERQRIASNGANLVRWALRGYDPQVQRAEAFIIEIDTSVLDRQ